MFSITQDKENWKRFLDVAARVNMYDFDEQLLIYAQRPKATACATLEQWNNSMNRWVRGGSKGIALIHRNAAGRPYLSYVFDVNDTCPIRGAKVPYVWKVEESNKAEVLTALEVRYGKAEGVTFSEKLMAVAGAPVRKWQEERYAGQGGGRKDVRDILTASVGYMLLARCKMTEAFTEDLALQQIRDFKEPAALYRLGDAVSNISRDILLEIRESILRMDLDVSENHKEKNENTLALSDAGLYNEEKGKFNTLIHKSNGVKKMEGLTYRRQGNYLIPNLILDGEEQTENGEMIGKYGLLRESFLQEHRHGDYTAMLLTGTLTPHLREIDAQAADQVERMVKEMMKEQGVDEALKAADQMLWVQKVNALTAMAEEMVLQEIVYQ